MVHIEESLKAPFTSRQMYDLVNDIEAYPEFIPACIDAGITNRQVNSIDAELILQKAGFSYRLKTHNSLFPHQRIELELISGPFSAFHGIWLFTEIDAYNSMIILQLDFKLKNNILKFALNKAFRKITREIISSFHQRAKCLYG